MPVYSREEVGVRVIFIIYRERRRKLGRYLSKKSHVVGLNMEKAPFFATWCVFLSKAKQYLVKNTFFGAKYF